jgi:hypothetical protein
LGLGRATRDHSAHSLAQGFEAMSHNVDS